MSNTSEDGVYGFDLYLNGPGKRVHCHGELLHNKRKVVESPSAAASVEPAASFQPDSNDGPSHVSKYRRQNAFVVEHVSHPGLTGPDPHAVSPATDTAATVDVPDTVPDTQPSLRRHLRTMTGHLWIDWFWVHLSSCKVVGLLWAGCWPLHMSSWCSSVQVQIALCLSCVVVMHLSWHI